jgi:hypothetical protein
MFPQEAAEGRMANNDGWNGVSGMASNTWKPGTLCLMFLIPFNSFYSSRYHEPVLHNEVATNLLW